MITCRATVLETEYHKRYARIIDLGGMPNVGHHLAVENEMGRAVFIVKEVVWEEGKLPELVLDSVGVAATSHGGYVLEAGSWTRKEDPHGNQLL